MHRVLIVDDRPDVRLLLRTRLEFERDIEVVGEAVNGAEAVTMVRALAPGAVVLDLMPDSAATPLSKYLLATPRSCRVGERRPRFARPSASWV